MERIGLIAGSGRFPVLFAETARRRGVEVVAVAHRRRDRPGARAASSQAITWVHPGELGSIIQALKQAGVTPRRHGGRDREAAALPRVPPRRAGARDARAGAARCATTCSCGRSRGELESEGIAVVESTLYLQEIVPGAGRARPPGRPTPEEWADIRFGFRAAKVIGQFDIGQSVVVRGGAVVAVEGIEGTDATIRRAGQLVNGDIVRGEGVQADPGHSASTCRRSGRRRSATLAEVRGRALAIEAGRTIMLDRAEMVALADAADIAVVAVDRAGRCER